MLSFSDNPRAYRQRAEALRGLKMFREAAADATHGLELRPGAWYLLVQRAMAYNEAGRFADALADAEAGMKGKPESAEAWLVRALARRSLGRSRSPTCRTSSARRRSSRSTAGCTWRPPGWSRR